MIWQYDKDIMDEGWSKKRPKRYPLFRKHFTLNLNVMQLFVNAEKRS